MVGCGGVVFIVAVVFVGSACAIYFVLLVTRSLRKQDALIETAASSLCILRGNPNYLFRSGRLDWRWLDFFDWHFVLWLTC